MDYVLVALFVGSNVFWAYLCLNLTNRLMSRNFYEYRQAERKPAKSEKAEFQLEERDEHAESQASELNALMGVV